MDRERSSPPGSKGAVTFIPLVVPPDPLPSDADHVVVAVHVDGFLRIERNTPPPDGLYLGAAAERHYWAVDAADDPDRDTYRDLRAQWGELDEPTWMIAGRGLQLVEWRRTHRFCGRCGSATEPARTERAMRCAACGLMAFPRLAPAVIMLVERDDGRILLARNVNFPIPMYSILAGFVEPGETMEEAVARETREEVGIEVTDIAYWGSQPWPFPHSLMVGFRARHASGDLVLQEDEIADAAWFAPGDLPMIPPPMSIGRKMIDAWVAERNG
jgi:NAD+ diphosphatase